MGVTEQMLHVAVSACVPFFTHSSLQQKRGLPLLAQLISWATLGRWHLTGNAHLRCFFWKKKEEEEKKAYCIAFFSLFHSRSLDELHTPVSPAPQHIPLAHSHIPSA